jgi:hypothetical protein
MPAFEFLSYDELMVIAVVGLIAVVYNWWDWIRDSLDHHPMMKALRPRLRRPRRRHG